MTAIAGGRLDSMIHMYDPPRAELDASADAPGTLGRPPHDSRSRKPPAPGDPISELSDHLSAGRPDDALRVLLESWIGVLTSPRSLELDALCARFPPAYTDDPRILLIRACAQDALGANVVAQMLRRRAHASAAERTDELPGLDWHLCFTDMVLLDNRSEVRKASERAWQLMSEGVPLDPRSRAAALHHIGWGFLRHRYEPEIGIEILEFARYEAGEIGDDVLRRRATGQLALMLAWAGRLRSAQRMLDDLDDSPEDYLPWRLNTHGDAAAATGYIAYLANDLELAKRSVASLKSQEKPNVSFAGTARVMLLLTAAASRDAAVIQQATLELQDVPTSDARAVSWEAFQHMCMAALAEASGHRDRAITIARRYAEHDDLPLVTVVLSGILRRAGKTAEALRMLQRLQQYRQFSYVRVATLSTAALLHYQRDRTASAHELCERALDIAAREGIRRPFCDPELDMRRLLVAHQSWGTHHEAFISECLTDHQVTLPLLRTLSERERAVYAQLRTTRTVNEIANDLDVSANTIKTHLKSIYKKLGVSSRREAVRLLLEDPT